MKANTILISSLAVAGFGIAQDVDAKKTSNDNSRPNIVFMIADDCRMLDLGCYGSPNAKTPNIDRLASQGVKFENFFQATAMSSPTRHCLLTGLYPARSGAYPNHTFINNGVQTLPTYLKQAGYRVALQGKRHIAPAKAFPFEYLGSEHVFNAKQIEPFLADAAAKKEPFFLYVASSDPHSPWTNGDQSLFDPQKMILPPTFVDTPQTRREYANYFAEINKLDSDLGKLDAMIEKYGLSDNTIFIFTSEQGYSFPFAKWTCYDGGLRTGFIIRWKGVAKPGSINRALCEYVDVTPTLIEIAGGEMPGDLDGKSFLPVIKKNLFQHKEYVYGMQTSRGIYAGPECYGIRSVHNDRYSYLLNLTPDKVFKCTSTVLKDKVWASWVNSAKTDATAAEKVKLYQYRPAEELYDIVADPFQLKNLATDPDYSKELIKMRKKLAAWMKAQDDLGQQTEMEAKKHQWKQLGGY